MGAPASAAQPNRRREGWLNSLGFEEVANFRDVAGVDASAPPMRVAGGHLRRGMLFRSAQLTFATPRDIARMRETLRIRTCVDLRSDEGLLETRHGEVYDHYPPSPVPQPPGRHGPRRAGELRRVSHHLLRGIGVRRLTQAEKDGDTSAEPDTWFQLALRDPTTKRVRQITGQKNPKETIEQLKLHLSVNNKAMLRLNGGVVAEVLNELAQPENYPLVFYCATGKDRTGLISCLVLGALGATEDAILADYMLSQACVHHNGMLAARNFELARSEHPEAFPDAAPMSVAPADPRNQVMASVFRSIMENTLAVIRELGGFEMYLRSIGFGAAQQRRLREILVVEDAAGSKL